MTAARPFGESAFLVEVDDAATAQQLRASLLERAMPGVSAVVPGRRSLLVEFDPLRVAADELQAALLGTAPDGAATAMPRTRRVPVVYGGEHGPDLADVAGLAGVTEQEVTEVHAALEHRVLFCGFAPGFAYLGDLPDGWRVPRLPTPRTRTPPGSIGVADGMTGIYPAELPGGWRVIGRTPITLFDPHRDPPTYLLPGDRVVFEPIGEEAWASRVGPSADW